MEQKAAENLAIMNDLDLKHTQGAVVCRQLRFEIHDLQGKYPVFCRVRPFLETEDPSQSAISFPENHPNGVSIFYEKVFSPLFCVRSSSYLSIPQKNETNLFEFDVTFKPEATQRYCFDEIVPLVCLAVDGKQTSILLLSAL